MEERVEWFGWQVCCVNSMEVGKMNWGTIRHKMLLKSDSNIGDRVRAADISREYEEVSWVYCGQWVASTMFNSYFTQHKLSKA
jgi:hypothetical protein